MKTNLVLIGMPGAGKSTIGALLAKAKAFDFIDVDECIIKRYNMPLQEMIDSQGVDVFLAREVEEIMRLSVENTVIATGGSAVLREEAMAHLTHSGHVIYLNPPLDVLAQRLTNMQSRGVAAPPCATLAEVYATRKPLYHRFAEITIDNGGQSAEETVAEILRLFP